MKPFRKSVADVITGGALSVMFGGLLVSQIMSGGVGSSIDFAEFLTTPGNLLFCVLMTLFTLSAWVMQGTNNRTIIFFWAILIVLNSHAFYSFYDYFLFEFKNIYALCVAGLVAGIPVVLLIRYRMIVSLVFCRTLWKLGVCRKAVGEYVTKVRTTDFEFDMKITLYMAFTVEFLYSLYMTCYGVLNQIPHYQSITEHMLENGNWSPTNLYYSLLDLATVGYILIVSLHIYRDKMSPDAFAFGLSKQKRSRLAKKLLKRHRIKATRKGER